MLNVSFHDRESVQRFVNRKLMADAAFRERFVAVAADGVRPIIVSMPEDPVTRLLYELHAVGDVGNVVVPVLNGVIVVSMEPGQNDDVSDDTLDATCTVGVFIERLRLDGGAANYEFASKRVGRAEVVALAG